MGSSTSAKKGLKSGGAVGAVLSMSPSSSPPSAVGSWVRVSQAARLGAKSDCLVVRWLLAAEVVLFS
jgi:hypothetical protein